MRILYLDLDTLTPSHLGCYGYHRNTSPTMDALAREGVRCTGAYCSDAPCLPSRTAFYQGRFGIQTGVVGHGGTAADPRREGPGRAFRSTYEEDAFPRQLQKGGYYTAMISPFGQRHAAHHYYAGFHEVHNTGLGGDESAEQVQPVVEKWLRDNAARDQWYLHINYWDIHTPYRAPLDYGNPFENDPPPPWITRERLAEHLRKGGPHSAQDLGMYSDANPERFPRLPARITDERTLKQWIDGFDTAIRYVDDHIARIVEMLKQAGVYEDTAIIISADHGENQGELGIYGEHGTADHATCNIPMIIKWPGGARGMVDHGLHYNVDVAPSVCELLNLPAPPIWDGESFAGVIRSGRGPAREELIISQCAHVCQRSVRWDRWLYMRTYHDGFHLFPREMLFDIGDDPHETCDLAEERPELCREGAWRLMRWHDAQMKKLAACGSDVTDPMWTVMHEGGPMHARLREPGRPGTVDHLEAYLRRLEETGRAAPAAALRAAYITARKEG